VKNYVLQRVKEERNILQTVKNVKINRLGHILHRNCLLKYFTKGTIEERIVIMGR
jgi:hypothetical protein